MLSFTIETPAARFPAAVAKALRHVLSAPPSSAFSAKVGSGFASENAPKQQLRARSLIPISLNAL